MCTGIIRIFAKLRPAIPRHPIALIKSRSHSRDARQTSRLEMKKIDG